MPLFTERPFTPRGQNLLTHVDELISPFTGTWDEELVKDMFWEEDAAVILGIPVHSGMDDCVAWHYNRTGIFSVRSAYKVFMDVRRRSGQRRRGGSVSSTASRGTDPFRKQLWQLKCPKKMVHMLWRMGHNSLALRVNLKRRGMAVDPICMFCGRYDEDGAHLFFKCKEVRQIWRHLQLEEVRQKLAVASSAREVLEIIFKLNADIQSRVITLLYVWWSERCSFREGARIRSADQLSWFIQTYAVEWSQFGKEQEQAAKIKIRRVWKPPPENVIKINCDGSFDAANRRGGWGYVLREWDGGVLAAGHGRLNVANEAFHSEIIACLQGVQRAADLGVQRVILESDASMVVHALQSSEYDLSTAGGLIWELKYLLASNFVTFEINHVTRVCNSVADSLASLGASLSLDAAPVVDSVPMSVCKLVAADAAACYE